MLVFAYLFRVLVALLPIESRIHVVAVGARLAAVPDGWTVHGSTSGREIKPGDEVREDDGQLILKSPPGRR
jgi:hypothetical protein